MIRAALELDNALTGYPTRLINNKINHINQRRIEVAIINTLKIAKVNQVKILINKFPIILRFFSGS